MKKLKLHCPICQNTKTAVVLTAEGYRFFHCHRCDLVYRSFQNRQNRDILYSNQYYRQGSKLKRKIEKFLTKLVNYRRKQLIEKWQNKGKILDLGCGLGQFLNQMNSRNWQKIGIEPSQAAYQQIAKLNFTIYQKELADIDLLKNSLDVITAWHVLEHLSNPKITLSEIHRILKKDGFLFFSTPNTDSFGFEKGREKWFHLDASRHLFLFNAKSLKKILNQTGFRIIKINYPFFEYPLDLFHSLNGVNKFVLGLGGKLISPFIKKTETIEIVCQKK